jgi:mitogen-activated protein kinase kinase kinase
MRKMLHAEVEMMKEFDHPNVIRYFGLFYTRETEEINIVLQYVEGGSVSKLIEAKKRISDLVAAHIIYQTLEGLVFLHENNIIHRDLKVCQTFHFFVFSILK